MRFAFALALAFILPLAASAYTIVMRGGRRIEIPARFTLTRTTLSYEVSEGISITLQVSAIDIAATERANHEPDGSLLRRAAAEENPAQTDLPALKTPQRAQRTITNRDLEASRRAREASEVAYERRRRELGLPSLELTRRRAAEEAERARAELRESEGDEAQAEAYWRSQASELRGQLAALDAQISYVRGILDQLPDRSAVGSYAVLTGIVPLVPGRGVGGFRQPRGNAGVFIAPNTGPQLTARAGLGGGMTRGRVFPHPMPFRGGFGRQFNFSQGLFASPLALSGPLSQDNSLYDDDRAGLVARLRELEAERAGLQARWRWLEDEARRAGALPGWLRP